MQPTALLQAGIASATDTAVCWEEEPTKAAL